MAMMIHFRKLVQSRVIWYIILAVIVISFVGFFTPSLDFGGSQQQMFAGKLFGKKVSMQDFYQSYNNAYLWRIFSTGQMVSQSPEVEAELRHEAWMRLAGLQRAKEEGIIVGDADVVRNIQLFPVFANPQTGQFDPGYYRAILQQLNVNPRAVEELFREQLVLSKLFYRNTQAALIAPSDFDRAYHIYTDQVTLDYAVLTRAAVEKEVTVAREQAEELFVRNPEPFRIPARVRVSYIELPVKNFLADVTVTDEEALQFYSRNLEMFRVETTNGMDMVQYKDFEEVRDDVLTQLKMYSARRAAATRASELVADMMPRTDGGVPQFKETATAAGLEIKTLPAFGLADEVPGIDPTANFARQAFELRADSYSSYSDPVIGENFVYILSLEQRYDSFLPSFDVVETKAMELARVQAVNEALARKALEVHGTLATRTAAGETFAAAAKEFNLTAATTPSFSLTSELDNPYASELMQISLAVAQGLVCEPAPVADGVLIAYVAERKTDDSEIGRAGMRDELTRMLENSRAQQLAAAWQATLLADAQLEETLPQQ